MNNYPYKNWMTTASGINALTLGELVWPGAHNCGVDYDFSYPAYLQPAKNWFVCQDGPFIQQLSEGVRAFDLRLHSDEHWLGIKKFHTFHGFKLLRGRSLSELVKSLNVFLDEHPDEFIVLDIRELKGINDQPFDYKGLQQVIMTELSSRLIPRSNRYLSLAQLKSISRVQRVVLASDSHPDFSSPLYWPKIRHEWSGSDITSPEQLKQHITQTLANPPAPGTLWSLSATSYGELAGVKRITNELNQWFGPESGWAPKCSIINADFIGGTRLVAYCHEINQAKGLRKARG
ncbi:phospholipase [Pseudomonas sp. NPDC087803]|uniref:phospholipase n=1 Tax=Pseudomonas sp. NPDC087803 TaxID=3364448 RepID=UPI0038287036